MVLLILPPLLSMETSLCTPFSFRLNILSPLTPAPADLYRHQGMSRLITAKTRTFTITPDPGYDIADVKVDGVSSGRLTSYTFTNIIAAHSIEASFIIKQYTFTINVTGQGSVVKSPDRPVYDHGTVVQLTANPASGWSFKDWSGDIADSGNRVNIMMTANKAITANFTTQPVLVTENASNITSTTATFTANLTGLGSAAVFPLASTTE